MKLFTSGLAASACVLFSAVNLMAENRIDAQRPDAPALAAYGEYKVGVRELSFTHANQIDILKIDPKAEKPDELPRYDRALTVEFWYPAAADATGSTEMKAFIRDGKTEVSLHGKAMRDAEPFPTETPYPLVIVSHGYPGNRFLMSHLAENIASKGYVVASIDHLESTYRTQAAFGSTLVNRSLDQLFILNEVAALAADPSSFLNGITDTDETAIIGYSMGGYGAIITAGGGVTQAAVDLAWGAPHGTLGIHLGGSDTHNALPDPRVKTAIAFGPWGMNWGFWDEENLKGVEIPMLFVAGSDDDVSGYENGVRAIWEGATRSERALLTFEHANHNAGAPMPAPAESYRFDEEKGFNLAEHYIDAVWDNVRMNNIAQHFVTAWLGKHLKGDRGMNGYLRLNPASGDGVWSKDDDGNPKDDHTYWEGFANRTAKGLRFEVLEAE